MRRYLFGSMQQHFRVAQTKPLKLLHCSFQLMFAVSSCCLLSCVMCFMQFIPERWCARSFRKC